jgi:hypothetical protein
MGARKPLAVLGAIGFMGCVGTTPSLDPEVASTTSPLIAEDLGLKNGWTNAPFSTRNAGLSLASGIVHLKGAIASGTGPLAFTLPGGFRPAANMYVPVHLCNATKGRLFIQPSGDVSIQTLGSFSDAQCFTSLEGATFAPSPTGFTTLSLSNGWTHAPFGTSNAAVEIIDGIVHFRGAISGGTSAQVFTLPSQFRPATMVYVPVDLCGAAEGRLVIQPSGDVTVETRSGALSDAQCFTSLDGAWFTQNPSAFTTLSPVNGWTHAPYGTASAGVATIGGVVHLNGAIAFGTSPSLFTLPSSFRPATSTYVPVDLCNATKGRLLIQPSGDATVQAEGGVFANAQCFISLEGASFSIAQPHGPASVGADANLFAVVDLTGTAITGHGVLGVTHFATGQYEVTFDTDVSRCAYVATTANAYSQALGVFTAGGHLGPQGVYVETKNQGGGLTDGPFHLWVACGNPGTRYAVVGYANDLVRASGGTSLSVLGTGRYAVTFESSIDACAYVATVGDPGKALVFNPSGVYTGSGADPRTVYIETKNPGGGLTAGIPFHLGVVCPPAQGARFAVVRSNGVAVRTSPSTVSTHTSTGRYQVITGSSTSECATVATRGSVDTAVPFTPATVEIIPRTSTNAAGIELRNLLFFGGALLDEAFHSATICSM